MLAPNHRLTFFHLMLNAGNATWPYKSPCFSSLIPLLITVYLSKMPAPDNARTMCKLIIYDVCMPLMHAANSKDAIIKGF